MGMVAGDGERSPRAAFERIDHHQPDHRQDDDHHQHHGDQRDEAADLADFLARHLPQRFAVAPQRAEQDHEILHRAAEHRADHDPQRARQIAELRGQRGPHQRSRSGDGREMVAEHDPLIGGLEIVPVAQAFGGRRAAVVERHHFGGQERRVETVADKVNANRSRHHPQAVDRLPRSLRQHGDRIGSQHRYQRPNPPYLRGARGSAVAVQ